MAAAVFHGKDKENLMKATYDLVKDDSCYGCRFAVPKSDKEIQNDGMFTRRFLCANLKRRDEMELEIIRAIVVRDYDKATNVLSTLVDALRCRNGMMKVVDATITPLCYQKKER